MMRQRSLKGWIILHYSGLKWSAIPLTAFQIRRGGQVGKTVRVITLNLNIHRRGVARALTMKRTRPRRQSAVQCPRAWSYSDTTMSRNYELMPWRAGS